MLPRRSLLLAVIFSFICLDLASANRIQIQRRAANSSPLPALTSASALPSESASPSGDASDSSGGSRTTESTSIKEKSTSVRVTSSSSTRASVTSHLTSVTSSSDSAATSAVQIFNATATPDELPITPQITPGFAVAGVLLLLSGIVYAIVGIRNRWLHIFLSACYLSSLAVTVLILYVMNPPVSNGIQGAYVVAITLTGLILGGASLMLMEMTEGLGCLFGGFCISMWLLVLKPGGLLTSTGPIVIFVVCFTLAGWATSFSHYTRPYGLISLMSFGGATVVVLGIDCFSRAGLKEFWAYIWNLNQNLFPLGATTYPLTRGMKVEIAAIVVLFLVGMASQSKLWTIIRKRREQRAAERLHDNRDLRHEEEKVGRRIEQTSARQRVYWEAVYGNRNNPQPADSGAGSINGGKEGSGSTVTSTEHSADHDIEMDEISAAPAMTGAVLARSKGPENNVTIRVSADDEPSQQTPQNESSTDLNPQRLSHKASGRSINKSKRESLSEEAAPVGSNRNSKRISKQTSEGPEVIPLPFKVHEGKDDGDDSSSVATFADDDHGNRFSRRFSQGSDLLRSLSQRSQLKRDRYSRPLSLSTEQLVDRHGVENDRSSIAATVDDLTDEEDSRSLPELSPQQSRTQKELDQNKPEPLASPQITKSPKEGPSNLPIPPEIDIRSKSSEEVTVSTKPDVPPQETSDDAPKDETKSDAEPPSIASVSDKTPVALTKAALPPAPPKVASSFRTNEWAKHLSNAEAPELEDLAPGHDPVEVEGNTDEEIEEAPAIVNVKELQQTAENASVEPAPRSKTQAPGYPYPAHVSRTNSYQSLQSSRNESASALYPHGGMTRAISQQSLQRPNALQMQGMRSYRNSSTPNIGQTLVESPIEDGPESFNPNSTLMGQRDMIVQNKSITGFNSLATTPRALSRVGSDVRLSRNSDARLEDDNISLSARRSMIRQSSLMTTTPNLPQNATFDSHQPRRQSSTPVNGAAKDFQLAQWRASVQQDLKAHVQPKKSIEKSRSALLQERMVLERQREMEQTKKGIRENVFDERMRKGDMLEAHREAMRRMQNEANLHV